ncbi:MAG TPA: YhfC family glutamic-type intramembrane protease [Anaerolineales bacterium]|nr:YhfC family glutamic-type intramembrane protease [Anaerolineales bacterium]
MDLLAFTHAFNFVLMFLLAFGVGALITYKYRLGWRLFWIGAATFILSQVGHIPFNAGLTQLFKSGILPTPPAEWQLPFNAVGLGLSAGLWEELTRYAVYRWWARDARSWRKGLLLGAGHGGIEAAFVGILVLLTFINMLAARNIDLTDFYTGEELVIAVQQVNTYWGSAWYEPLAGALERAFSIPAQIALSILVLQVFTRKQIRWLWAAIAWHAVIDAVAVYLSATYGVWVTEAAIGVTALLN